MADGVEYAGAAVAFRDALHSDMLWSLVKHIDEGRVANLREARDEIEALARSAQDTSNDALEYAGTMRAETEEKILMMHLENEIDPVVTIREARERRGKK